MYKENNILIAEFIGMQKTNIGWFDAEAILSLSYTIDNTFDNLKFNSSWDWLIPVLNKILDITFSDDEQETYDSDMFYNIRDCIPKLSQTYQAVIEFIKIYNKNK